MRRAGLIAATLFLAACAGVKETAPYSVWREKQPPLREPLSSEWVLEDGAGHVYISPALAKKLGRDNETTRQ